MCIKFTLLNKFDTYVEYRNECYILYDLIINYVVDMLIINVINI